MYGTSKGSLPLFLFVASLDHLNDLSIHSLAARLDVNYNGTLTSSTLQMAHGLITVPSNFSRLDDIWGLGGPYQFA
jgi:hypothetical protein